MPFATTWIKLETLLLSGVKSERERQIPCITYLGANIQHKGNFPQKRKSWTWRIDLWLPKGKGRELVRLGAWGK